MRRACLLWPVLLIGSALAALADARMTVLVDVLRLPEAAQILSDEGVTQAGEINEDMLDGQGGAGFQLQVERIYDPALMVELVRRELEAGLDPEEREAVIAFYGTALGEKVIQLENSARQAIQDPDVEAAARERFRLLRDSGDVRLGHITRYVDNGDMISRNVASAINSNYQFLRGLVDGGAMELSEEEMLADAARDLDESTEDTTEWLFGFLLLAYHPLEEAELDAYVAFSDSAAGQALNAALFNGFAKAYEDISYALGRAVALNMTAQEL